MLGWRLNAQACYICNANASAPSLWLDRDISATSLYFSDSCVNRPECRPEADTSARIPHRFHEMAIFLPFFLRPSLESQLIATVQQCLNWRSEGRTQDMAQPLDGRNIPLLDNFVAYASKSGAMLVPNRCD